MITGATRYFITMYQSKNVILSFLSQAHPNLNHPFSLTVFESKVYWTDWQYNTLVMCDKFNGSDVKVIYRTYTQPFDLQVYHKLRQPKGI